MNIVIFIFVGIVFAAGLNDDRKIRMRMRQIISNLEEIINDAEKRTIEEEKRAAWIGQKIAEIEAQEVKK